MQAANVILYVVFSHLLLYMCEDLYPIIIYFAGGKYLVWEYPMNGIRMDIARIFDALEKQ